MGPPSRFLAVLLALSVSARAVSVSQYISQAMFDTDLFPNRAKLSCPGAFYTYQAFITAAAAFQGFGTSSTDEVNKRELAAFLAQISHETTGGAAGQYKWGLCFVSEIAGPTQPNSAYCSASAQWPCNPDQAYYGRGPIQLSWNYNYIAAGRAIGFDGLNDPGLVARDAVIAFKTAIWFWMTPQAPKPSCHDVMVGTWTPSAKDRAAGRLRGFGQTTNIINGRLECNKGQIPAQANRIGYYKAYCTYFGVSTGPNLSCARARPY